MEKTFDTAICPLCQQENGCMINTAERCWCVDIIVPQGLVDLVAEEFQRQVCICRLCIEKYNENPDTFVIRTTSS